MEYALIVGLVAVAAIAVIDGFTGAARDSFNGQVASLAGVAGRATSTTAPATTAPPAPTTTAPPATTTDAPTTTVDPGPVGPTTTAPPASTTAPPATTTSTTTTSTTTTTAAPTASTGLVGAASVKNSTQWDVSVTISVNTSNGTSANGYLVTGTFLSSKGSRSVSCTTGGAGTCTVGWSGLSSSQEATVTLYLSSATGTNAWTGSTSSVTVTAP